MKTLRFLAVSSLLVMLYSPLAHADVCSSASCVAAGTDYFQTTTGSMVNLGSLGSIPLVGVPISGSPVGTADTIIQRLSDVPIDSNPYSSLQMMGLSLESAAPVNLGSGFADLFITLDPGDLALDTGSITISGGLTGGTFSSTLDVYFDVCIGGDTGTGVGCGSFTPLVSGEELVLSQSGATWGPTPAPGEALDEGAYTDSPNPYNEHTGLPSNVVDFFPGMVTETEPGATHVVDPAPVPEPTSLILLATNLLVLVGTLKLRFHS
jgi:hypothetical protein